MTDPTISPQIQIEQQQIRIKLTSFSLARQVECALEGTDVVFSDNYFDLPAGRTVEISVPLPPSWTFSQVTKALRVRSIYDSYAYTATN